MKSTALSQVTTIAQKIKLGVGASLKVHLSDTPVNPVIFTLDVPGQYAKYIVFEVTIWFFTAKFSLLAVV